MDDKKAIPEYKLDNITVLNKGISHFSSLSNRHENQWEIINNSISNSNYNSSDLDSNTSIIPSKTKKVFIMTIGLLFFGLVLIFFGLISYIFNPETSQYISCFILGTLLLIPGVYYIYQFYIIKKTKNKYEKERIINSLPKI